MYYTGFGYLANGVLYATLDEAYEALRESTED